MTHLCGFDVVVWTVRRRATMTMLERAMRGLSTTTGTFTLKSERFSHDEADAIAAWAVHRQTSLTVTVDLSHASDASTAAFARLVVLRRQLRRQGRELQVSGLRDRALWVYVISRLNEVLPQHVETPLAAAA